jgi:hypothetical protein
MTVNKTLTHKAPGVVWVPWGDGDGWVVLTALLWVGKRYSLLSVVEARVGDGAGASPAAEGPRADELST